ncbi:MAG: asparagine synthase (glutamine-hydrolyzing) [Lachnospiraceae bacterium]|nr:asparagine synthase (glutamine-hydrolyzing) [Lachnospiraceae bacterium]
MCGIAGLLNFKGDIEKNITAMQEAMIHRGPDEGGVWMSENKDVVFAHRRLKIIDLTASGAQPMKSASGRYIISYNGEIYNHKKIADRLIRENKVNGFKGTSDTEIILAAIEAYGLKEALKMSKGMFAIALYDLKEKTLFLARDRVGEKPLYYGFVNQTFVFASDLNAIKALDDFNQPINKEVLSLYFIYGYIPAPYSIYQGINKLDAGMILEIKTPFNEITTYPYWSMKEIALYGQTNLFKGSRMDAADELDRMLKDVIREQMVADVPVGVFLSAGIDSSTIASVMQSQLTEQVKSYTIGLPGVNDEAVHAKKIAAHLGLDHTEYYISEDDAKAIIPMISGMFGEPFADSSQIPTYLVSKMTREHVTVSLSGDAGDELFCGYNSYRSVERAYRKLRMLPYPLRGPLSKILLNGPIPLSRRNRIRAKLLNMKSVGELYINSMDYDSNFRKISLTDKNIPCKFTELEPHFLTEPNHQLILMDLLMYTPDDILVKVDRTAMAVSLETRAPLLDKDIIEFAFSLPIEYKRDENAGKLILRDVLYRYVPKELMERPKQGFAIPINKWLKEPELRAWAERLIDRETLVKQGILNPDIVRLIWNNFIENNVFIPQIWYILIFQQWMCQEVNS